MSMAEQLLERLRGAAARQDDGEAVSEQAHALQCADLAEASGADEELILACLLHDVGRWGAEPGLAVDGAADLAPGRGAAPAHHEAGAGLIAPWVPERVRWLVAAHTEAKRYLCAAEPAYHGRLSPASRRTLPEQGGAMATGEAERFAGHPWARDAVRLRRWDDEARVPGRRTGGVEHWAPLLRVYFERKPLPEAFRAIFAGLPPVSIGAVTERFQRCFGCGPAHPTGLRVQCFARDGEVVSPIVIADRHAGPPGAAHGGIVAAYLDEVLSAATVHHVGRGCVTGELAVRYLHPTPVETPLVGRGRAVRDRSKYVELEGTIEQFETGTVTARATARFFPVA